MTETDDLKQKAAESKARQQVESVGAYLNSLSREIDSCIIREQDAWIIYMIAWGAWMIAGFITGNDGGQVMELIFFISLVYQSYRHTRTRRAFGEFAGAIKVLELLGMVPPRPPKGERESKKRVWSEGIDIVRGWAAKKQKAQEEAYAPA